MNKYERYDANTRMHVHIAQKALGRTLKGEEQVHHVDFDKSHNNNENLVICPDRTYHMLLHRRTESLDAIGDPNGFRCCYCKTYDFPHNLVHMTRKSYKHNGKIRHYHKECHNKFHRDRRVKLRGV